MRVHVRFLGQPIGQLEISQDKSYSIGRNPECDLNYSHAKISRLQGHLYFENGCWRFKDLGSDKENPKIYELKEDKTAVLPNGLEIFLAEYLANEQTSFTQIGSLEPTTMAAKKPHKLQFILGGATVGILILIGLTIYFSQISSRPMDAKKLINFANTRIVRFELFRNKKSIDDIKKVSKLQDKDFKDRVGFCTGFIIAKNTILTAHHCLFGGSGFEPLTEYLLKTHDGVEHKATQVLGFDIQRDYMIIAVDGLEKYGQFEFAPSWEIGQKVFTVGNVEGEGLGIRDGLIAGHTEDSADASVKYLRFSAAASPGNSGGPLLNDRGQVVALVSAKSTSENYNIGIEVSDLKAAVKKYSDDRSPKEILFDSKKVATFSNPRVFLNVAMQLGLPVQDIQFEDNAEAMASLMKFEMAFKVPMKIEEAYGAILSTLNSKIIEQLNKNEAKAIDAGESGSIWENQITAELPLIVPVNFTAVFGTDVEFTEDKKMLVPPVSLFQHRGKQGHQEAVEKKKKGAGLISYTVGNSYYSGENIRLKERVPAKEQVGFKIYSTIKDNKDSLKIGGYYAKTPSMSIIFDKPDSDSKKREVTIKETYKKVLFGPKGAQFPLEYHPFVRPNVDPTFVFTDFSSDFDKTRQVKDKRGRAWEVFESELFGVYDLALYCLDSPLATHCISEMTPREVNASVKAVFESNLINYELSEKLAYLDFIPSSLVGKKEFTSHLNHHPELEDFEVTLDSQKNIVVKLKSLNYSMTIGSSAEIESFQLLPGLFKENKDSKPRWVALAVNFLKSVPGKNKNIIRTACTTGIDVNDYSSHPLAAPVEKYNYLTGLGGAPKNPNRKLASQTETDSAVWRKRLPTQLGALNLKGFGTCGSIEPDLMDKNMGIIILETRKAFKPAGF